MPQVLIVSTEDLPHPVPETDLLVAALNRLDVASEIVPWHDPSVAWAGADMVLIRTPWDYIHKLEHFLLWLRTTASQARLWNPREIIEWNIHKRYLVELIEKEVPVIPTFHAQQGTKVQLTDIEVLKEGQAFIIKPTVSVGAIGSGHFQALDEKAQTHLESLLETGDALVQPFVPEVTTVGEVSMIYFGGAYSHAVIKRPAQGDYRVHAEYGGSVTVHTPSQAEHDLAQTTLAAINADVLYARVDLVPAVNGPLLMELELIEPELFFPYADGSPDRFAAVIEAHLGS